MYTIGIYEISDYLRPFVFCSLLFPSQLIIMYVCIVKYHQVIYIYCETVRGFSNLAHTLNATYSYLWVHHDLIMNFIWLSYNVRPLPIFSLCTSRIDIKNMKFYIACTNDVECKPHYIFLVSKWCHSILGCWRMKKIHYSLNYTLIMDTSIMISSSWLRSWYTELFQRSYNEYSGLRRVGRCVCSYRTISASNVMHNSRSTIPCNIKQYSFGMAMIWLVSLLYFNNIEGIYIVSVVLVLR